MGYHLSHIVQRHRAEAYEPGSGGGGCSPPDWGEAIMFWAKAKFFGQKPAAKNEIFFVFIKRKTEFVQSSEIKCPKSGIFTNNYWVG